jgi:hypothetical protein
MAPAILHICDQELEWPAACGDVPVVLPGRQWARAGPDENHRRVVVELDHRNVDKHGEQRRALEQLINGCVEID